MAQGKMGWTVLTSLKWRSDELAKQSSKHGPFNLPHQAKAVRSLKFPDYIFGQLQKPLTV
jgi:hypothetical protein